MKKLLQALAVLFAVTVLFVGCNKDAEPAAASDTAPLFNESATPLSAKGVILSDGNWKFRIITKYQGDIVNVYNAEFTVENADLLRTVVVSDMPTLTYTKISSTYEGEYSAADLVTENNNITENFTNFSTYHSFPKSVKTNDAGTKFYAEDNYIPKFIDTLGNELDTPKQPKEVEIEVIDEYFYDYFYLMKK